MDTASTITSRTVLFTWLSIGGMLAFAALPPAYSLSLLSYLALAVLVQATLFTLPLALFGFARLRLPRTLRQLAILDAAQVMLAVLLTGFVAMNLKLYDLYGFHANYFVWNLVTTPGGIAAMGINSSTWTTMAVSVAAIPPLAYAVVKKSTLQVPRFFAVKKIRLVFAFLLCLFSEGLIYAYADYNGDTALIGVADHIVWHIPVTAKSAFGRLGLPRKDVASLEIKAGGGKLAYPGNNIPAAAPAGSHPAYNIVWLVAESWRADAVNPQVMPATYSFANDNLWFREHYSGGNGTRMGMFTQFYGLYGSYWFDILQSRKPPVLMQYLRDRGYQFSAFTSSAFTYPEFDKTIFSNLPPESLHADSEGYGWQRDQRNTGKLLEYIQTAAAPFFAFMFFESSHANYYFPPGDEITSNYLRDFNYITTDIEENIEQIHNRYLNATHHLDRQLARVFAALQEQNLLDSTIVVVTGDHGEEFMENGRWGHNSTFSQQQIRVPLILHLPHEESRHIDRMTSHLDLPATILSALNVFQPPQEFSYGSDLLAPDYRREFAVVSDWHGNTLVTPDVKITFSMKGAAKTAAITNLLDQPISSQTGLDNPIFRRVLTEFTRSLNRFYR